MAKDLARRVVRMGRGTIAVVSDPSPKALEEAAAEFGAVPIADFEKACARTDVDAVMVGSPGAAHCDNVLAAAANMKHVYCEKPLAITVAECDRMIAACEAAGVKLFVGHVLRLMGSFWHSKTLIDQGAIGEPRTISVKRSGYATMFHAGWRTKREITGSMLHEVHVHELDYMRFVLGEPIEVYGRFNNILGRMDYEDSAFVIVGFKSGATGCLHADLCSPTGEYRVAIAGTGGSMLHSGFGGDIKYKALEGDEVVVDMKAVCVPDAYDCELISWLDSITSGAEPLFPGEHGRTNIAMVQAALRSAELGRPVKIAEL
jgi:predicted dehydrogenase